MSNGRTAISSTHTRSRSGARPVMGRAARTAWRSWNAASSVSCVARIAKRSRRRPVAARAIWKGRLQLGKEELAVKLYSAIEDRTVRFHLLHAKDRAPVEQHIVRKDTG